MGSCTILFAFIKLRLSPSILHCSHMRQSMRGFFTSENSFPVLAVQRRNILYILRSLTLGSHLLAEALSFFSFPDLKVVPGGFFYYHNFSFPQILLFLQFPNFLIEGRSLQSLTVSFPFLLPNVRDSKPTLHFILSFLLYFPLQIRR